MNSQSQFCFTAALNEVSDPKRGFGHNHRAGERLNRARRVGIDDTRQRIAQIEAIVADFDRTATGSIRSNFPGPRKGPSHGLNERLSQLPHDTLNRTF
jgi:hypothetical protein